MPAEGVQHERVEVVAEEAEDEIQRRLQIADCRLQIVRAGVLAVVSGCRLRTGREDTRDFGGRRVEEERKSVDAGGVEARA